ncbi:MAG: hypothetical protein U5N86_02860 [Planctomycetota bacterium]|nr:hypothetical protein [Planctomycetota bacterium]
MRAAPSTTFSRRLGRIVSRNNSEAFLAFYSNRGTCEGVLATRGDQRASVLALVPLTESTFYAVGEFLGEVSFGKTSLYTKPYTNVFVAKVSLELEEKEFPVDAVPAELPQTISIGLELESGFEGSPVPCVLSDIHKRGDDWKLAGCMDPVEGVLDLFDSSGYNVFYVNTDLRGTFSLIQGANTNLPAEETYEDFFVQPSKMPDLSHWLFTSYRKSYILSLHNGATGGGSSIDTVFHLLSKSTSKSSELFTDSSSNGIDHISSSCADGAGGIWISGMSNSTRCSLGGTQLPAARNEYFIVHFGPKGEFIAAAGLSKGRATSLAPTDDGGCWVNCSLDDGAVLNDEQVPAVDASHVILHLTPDARISMEHSLMLTTSANGLERSICSDGEGGIWFAHKDLAQPDLLRIENYNPKRPDRISVSGNYTVSLLREGPDGGFLAYGEMLEGAETKLATYPLPVGSGSHYVAAFDAIGNCYAAHTLFGGDILAVNDLAADDKNLVLVGASYGEYSVNHFRHLPLEVPSPLLLVFSFSGF